MLWNTETTDLEDTFSWHTDYVQALASSPLLTLAASTGLDAKLVLWDIEVPTSFYEF